MYYGDFRERIQGKKILELGCGNCFNAVVMASLGAQVYANDISDKSGEIIEAINKEADFEFPIQYIQGDFLRIKDLPEDFDYVVGKAFLHHLTHEQELEFLRKIVSSLKKDGEVRFVEPAVNNKFLDKLRWAIPVSGRPSSFQSKKFKMWLSKDPHPIRDNSGKHFKQLGLQFFNEINIYSVGAIERFHRLFPDNDTNKKFRNFAYKIELIFPNFLRYELARTQTVIYKLPRKPNSNP
jgi:SAM-dependent methyltransferase